MKTITNGGTTAKGGDIPVKLLPFCEKPLYICYYNPAFPLGIIAANAKEDILPWVCSKSIDLWFNTACTPNEIYFADRDFWGVDENILTRLYLWVHKEVYDVMDIDFSAVIHRMLDNNFYVYGTHNERYIPGKNAYQNFDFMHDYLLIGYDEDSFISAGFLADERFQIYHIPKKDMIQSLTNVTSARFIIRFYSFNEAAELKVDVLKMISDLERYIAQEAEDIDTVPGDAYGIAAMRKMRRMFWETMHVERPYIDKRAARLLYEHSWALSKILELFLDPQTVDPSLKEAMQKNERRAQTVHFLGMKLRMTRNEALFPRIDTLVGEIIDSELQWLPILTAALKEKYM